ncbi:MAG: hypothetical protein ABSC94_09920 [Polyangiaceae bacterium]|jgi:vacuolar-type H+-ATPase subunit H
MIRPIVPLTLTAALCAAFGLGCDKPGATELQREEKASDRVTQTRNEASEQVQNAQASANTDIAQARSDFDKDRADYWHERTTDLGDLDKRIADLDAKGMRASGQVKARLQANLAAIHAQRDAFARDLQGIHDLTAASWDESKTNLDKEWDSLKKAVDHAD